jgi:pimeloyl-ACP methyl ester carboxylesterase
MPRPRPRARRRAAAVGLALLLVVGACGDDDEGASAPTTQATTVDGGVPDEAAEGPNGFRPDPIEWEGCGSTECASVVVPLDYDDPTGETISLMVVRAPATGERQGALFVNPGGPGGSATEFATLLPLLLPSSITERYDVVGVEPRGLPGSAPLECGLDYADVYGVDPTVEDAADRAALLESAAEVASACAAGSGHLLPHVGTRDVARDLDAVRAAMGEAQLSYYGASYGSAIGQVYADLFPGRIRGMVLDGIVDVAASGLDQAAAQAAGFETALQSLAGWCERNDCPVDDLMAAVDEVQEAAEERGGIPAPDADRSAGPDELSLGLAQGLYSQSTWPELAQALADAQDGDGSGIVALADVYLGIVDFDPYFAVNCTDLAWPRGDADAFFAAADEAGRASPHFGEALVADYLRCVDWPVPADPLPAITAPGTPPILVVSTTGDPATPHANGVAVAERLEAGVLVVNRGEGHGALTSAGSCISAIVAAYLIDGVVPEDGATC